MRIHKAMSSHGPFSLRGAEKLIKENRVTVNGRPAYIGQDVNPEKDIICVDKQRITLTAKKQKLYIALNKPRGYVTTMSDELGRKCVAQLIGDLPVRVFPIGRLDKSSEGLLLLTNDGEFANKIMHPKSKVGKTYRVTVRPGISEEQLIALETGVLLDGGMTLPAKVQVRTNEPGRVVLNITILEGKNRQIRRMCEALGLEVARLKRIAIGPLRLGMLKPGTCRELTAQELTALRNASGKKGADV